MNSSQLSISRFEDEFFTPTPMTYLLFSLSLETSGEKSLSPDSTWFTSFKDHNLWLRSPLDQRTVRLTSDGVEFYGWEAAQWSPDGRRIVFVSRRKGRDDLYMKSYAGSGTEEPILESGRDTFPTSWSADGRSILYLAGDQGYRLAVNVRRQGEVGAELQTAEIRIAPEQSRAQDAVPQRQGVTLVRKVAAIPGFEPGESTV